MRRRGALAAAVASLAALTLPSPALADRCDEESWTAGVVELCGGKLVYRDYLFDDYGADNGSSQGKSWGSLAAQAGDQRYPDDAENSADIVDVALWVEGGRLHARFRLSALYSADQTAAAIAIDTDANQDTGGGEWPGVGVRSRGWEVVHVFDRGDPARNVIEGDVPLPPGSRWHVQALTARRGGPVMNVAFRGMDEQGSWWENRQAAVLRSGDITEFGADVNVADLQGGMTRGADPPASGTFQRVYRSAYTIPPDNEGYDYDGTPGRAPPSSAFGHEYHFFGEWQPYGIHIPTTPASHGIQLVMHGYSANHASLVRNGGMQRNIAEARNRILLVPLGRGPAGFYSDYSERDVLDVLADVESTYATDRERVFTGGYSMGGYGSLRMAALHPHRFAGFINWVGFTGDDANGSPSPLRFPAGAIGNMVDFAGNFRHIPGAHMYGGADELVHVWTAEEMNRRFREDGGPYSYFMHPAAEHFTFALADDWRKESEYTKDLVRATRPARVTYRTATVLDAPQLGIRHDRAYWVSQIRGGDQGYQDVDLTTYGCGGSLAETEMRRGAGVDPVPYESESKVVTGERRLPRENRLEGRLANVSSLIVDTRDACLSLRAVAYDITTDGSARIEFSDGRTLELSGAGRHQGTLPAARLRLQVTPRRVPAGSRTRFSFRVTAEGRPLPDATVRLAGRRTRTNARGRARLRVRLRRVRAYRARAIKEGLSASARVRAVAAQRGPRFTG